MKQFFTCILIALVALVTMIPDRSRANNPLVDGIPEAGSVWDSGCLDKTRTKSSPDLILTKDGDIVTFELNGFVANCSVDLFNVDTDYRKGEEVPDTLFVNVKPIVLSEKDCTCLYNVSFTIRNVESDNIFLNCWLYSGMISFKESNQVNLEVSSEFVTLDDGSRFFLYKPSQIAVLFSMSLVGIKDEYCLPSTVSYKGEDYTVVSFYPDALQGPEITKLILPNTIRMIGTGEELYNSFNGRFHKLETIEVESGCPLLSSVDGVLYSRDHKTIYCFPEASKLTEYMVVDGVETVGKAAFQSCQNLRSIRLPESVTTIRPYAFASSNNLESIYIQGKLDRDKSYYAFSYMTSKPTLYVPESEIEYIKTLYKGPVLPLSSAEQTVGISDVNKSNATDSYDLQGRRLNDKSTKGVYIENGRKVVIK